MPWIAFFFAAFVALCLDELFGTAAFAFVAGGLLGAMGWRLHRQGTRIAALESRVAQRAEPAGMRPPAPAMPSKPIDTGNTASSTAARIETPLETPRPPPAETASRPKAPAGRTTPASPPREPAPFDRWVAAIRAALFEGNVPVKLGLLVSLLGIAALLRYASAEGWLTLPVAYRYAGIALAALGMLAYGLRQTGERPVFGLSLQGGAIAILLLTVFAAFRVPGLLPAVPAFALVVALVASGAILALRQNAPWLAGLALFGGYIAPLMLSTGIGNHVALFTWYAVIDLAVFVMAWWRPWRALNLLAFVATFGVATAWGVLRYEPALFWSTEPFLIGFFLLFVALPVLYARRGDAPGKVDATLLFGTPLLAFPLQVGLLEGERWPLAFSALAVAAVYLGVASASRRDPRLAVLSQGSAALALAFATLAIPLALSASWTSATWALQGAALLWLGQVQERRWPRVLGIALQGLAAGAFIVSVGNSGRADVGPFAPETLNLLVLALGAGLCGFLLDRPRPSRQSAGGGLLWAIAMCWWLVAVGVESVHHWDDRLLGDGGVLVLGAALGLAISGLLGRRMAWRRPPDAGLAMGLLAVVGVAACSLQDEAWLGGPRALLLLAFTGAWLWAMPAFRAAPRRLALTHAGGLGAIALALGLGLRHALGAGEPGPLGDGWQWTLPWLPLAVGLTLAVRVPRWGAWPVADVMPAYPRRLAMAGGAALGVVGLAALGAAGDPSPLPFLPLLNPLDLAYAGGVLALATAMRKAPDGSTTARLRPWVLGPVAFAMLTLVVLRASLWWIPGLVSGSTADWLAVLDQRSTQVALSVTWSLAGVACWIGGSRRGSRALWTFGAALLGGVLLKLAIVDRHALGDLGGIASFLVVGSLLVVVGRIAPRPPSRTDTTP